MAYTKSKVEEEAMRKFYSTRNEIKRVFHPNGLPIYVACMKMKKIVITTIIN